MPINVEVIGKEVLGAMADFYQKARNPLLEGLLKTSDKFIKSAEGRSKKEFLTGPRPEKLGVKTGRLRSSIHGKATRDGANIEAVLGTNVKYAARWELGFTGTETVKAHHRFIKKAFGKSLSSPVLANIGSFSRKVDSKAKPFLSPAVSLELPQFESDIALTMGKDLSPGDHGVQ